MVFCIFVIKIFCVLGTSAADSRAALLLLMEFLFDPTLWVGLLTLVVLRLVLGIDNLVLLPFWPKLPAKQQDRALYTGLGMAIFLRLALLSVMSWLVGLTPLFTLWGTRFPARPHSLRRRALLAFKATSRTS